MKPPRNCTRQIALDRNRSERISARMMSRRYAGDALCHLYFAVQVDDRAWEYLTPACQYDTLYPHRHPRDMLSEHDELCPASLFDVCPGCARWARHNRHSILIRGLVPL
ncbi:hypothetical protein [Amycolatopsis anabasis]|uniref:hypothetical protein n=1 Tax=Amycolatopsis anabasis TaxID=1840409 RepID=UPI00131B7B6F|nr:hypothetical protein [Amycolatopsis anabasis]